MSRAAAIIRLKILIAKARRSLNALERELQCIIEDMEKEK